MDTESCSILLVDGELRNCFVVASKGHPEVDMLELDLDNYPEVRRALTTREPVVIEDVETDPLVAAAREVLLEKGYRSLLVVPLLFGREVLGTLFLRARREKPFNADEIRFCKVAAGTSANALKNALLYREVPRRREHRATGEKLGRVLDSTPGHDRGHRRDRAGSPSSTAAPSELTGWTAEQAAGRAFARDPRRRRSIAADRGGATEERPPEDVAFRNARGEDVEISLVSAPLSGRGRAETGRVWIGRDVTKLRRVEKSLAQAERLSSLGEVVAGVAHELNNPLSGVVGYAELLRGHADRPGPDARPGAHRRVGGALPEDRLQAALLRAQASAGEEVPEPQRMRDARCSTSSPTSCVRRRSTTHLELDPDLPRTSFDFHQIEQVILNLLNNAEQAISGLKSPGNDRAAHRRAGRIRLRRGRGRRPGVPAGDSRAGLRSLLHHQGRRAGDRARPVGLLRDRRGARRTASSCRRARGERGACFTVYLPIDRGRGGAGRRRGRERDRRRERSAPARAAAFCVAEDEPLVLELLTRVLSDDGAEVTLAQDGAGGLGSAGDGRVRSDRRRSAHAQPRRQATVREGRRGAARADAAVRLLHRRPGPPGDASRSCRSCPTAS